MSANLSQSGELQVQRITHLYPTLTKSETSLNLNYPTYPMQTLNCPLLPIFRPESKLFEPKAPNKLYTHTTRARDPRVPRSSDF